MELSKKLEIRKTTLRDLDGMQLNAGAGAGWSNPTLPQCTCVCTTDQGRQGGGESPLYNLMEVK